jgi:4-hydroxy-3-polyprenylbenzoate decarboxylase
MSPKHHNDKMREATKRGFLSTNDPRRIVIGISGGSGVIYGIRLLEFLHQQQKRNSRRDNESIETHLIISPAAAITIKAETDYSLKDVEKLTSKVYRFGDIAAPMASGSFRFDSMVIVPCSMHTLGAIASGIADNLLVRAAEVTLKEKRRLILVPRETPLTLIHLQNMVRASEAGAIIVPAMPAFYQRPKTIDDIVNHLVGKILDLLEIENNLFKRWKGMSNP